MKKFIQEPKLFINAANKLGCRVEALLAVIAVETPSPHIGDTQYGPIILNERHKFYKYLPKSKTGDNRLVPSIYSSKAGGYESGRNALERQRKEHLKLAIKMEIDKVAALMSISMGLFQIMGFNYELIGYKNVEDMWKDALKKDDVIDLEWFVKFVKANKLDRYLRALRFDLFAKGYNGPNYHINKYDVRMRDYYVTFCRTSPLKQVKEQEELEEENSTKENLVIDAAIKFPNIETLIPVTPPLYNPQGFPIIDVEFPEIIVE